jgi:N-acetylmuramoyl-L-alanine amidase
MPWNRQSESTDGAPTHVAEKSSVHHPLHFYLTSLAIFVIVLNAAKVSEAAPEKHLTVYSVAANYSLPIVQREGHDYIGLLELLEPLGKVSAKAEGQRWRIHYNNIEGDFTAGKSHANVQGRDVDLSARFLLENGRGFAPIAALGSLLPRILGGPVTLHEDSGRLFIGSIATHFTASLAGDNASRLIFHFTSPVNPSVSTEPGTLRMVFSREPLVSPASTTLTFGSKTIPSAAYSEANGAAVITVKSAIPVIANFSNDGRTVTIFPTSSAGQNSASAPQSGGSAASATSSSNPVPAASANPAQPANVPASSQPPVIRRYFAVVDASHGGDDRGESLSSTLLEKDITLALAHSLRQELESRGITTLVLRDSDATLSLDQRATLANSTHAAIYIALHAASSGHGVRIYTALIPYGGDDRGPFHDWTTSQHASLALSQTTATEVSAELQKRQIPVRTLAAPLRPLNNVVAAALAVEVAPQGSDSSQLTAPDYQQLVMSAVATAVASARAQLGATP